MSPGSEAAVGERLHQRGWRKAFTVTEMVDKWAWLVGEVDDDGLALDRFHKIPHPDLWWWRRHPRTLTGDLGRSLRSAGATGA
ncbi:hypothetical protein P3T35_003194 [Kitasatospora sp. GP30]|uniref:hypothetical protein n=1 Tax=Kitasatospora sp. GP30 TaxID=3035084 RepID=UPI000C711026|nr:hypothetical protein [Kitasatospora sp. GP30]MDH6141177.1 hypothetical protein [Kitasatospora sp. GP30]